MINDDSFLESIIYAFPFWTFQFLKDLRALSQLPDFTGTVGHMVLATLVYHLDIRMHWSPQEHLKST